MLSFAIACVLMITTPGPAVLTIAGIGSGYGFAAGNRFLWGLFTGNATVVLMVVTGLAALVFSVPYVREAFLFFSVTYLLYLAYRIAFAGANVGFEAAASAPGYRDGFVFQLINPKCYAASTLLYTGFSIYPDHYLFEVTLKSIVWFGIWVPIHYVWLYLGNLIKRLNLSEKRQRQVNMFMASSLVVVVFLAVIGNFLGETI